MHDIQYSKDIYIYNYDLGTVITIANSFKSKCSFTLFINEYTMQILVSNQI